ncbi:Phage head-tail joining protein [compost metagenome]
MRLGTLNRQVKLQRLVETPTGTGGSTIAWVDVATVWANIRLLNGLETVKSDFPVGVSGGSVRIRWREDVDPTWRVLYVSNGIEKVFAVTAVLPDLVGREFIDLSVQTGVNNG